MLFWIFNFLWFHLLGSVSITIDKNPPSSVISNWDDRKLGQVVIVTFFTLPSDIFDTNLDRTLIQVGVPFPTIIRTFHQNNVMQWCHLQKKTLVVYCNILHFVRMDFLLLLCLDCTLSFLSNLKSIFQAVSYSNFFHFR